MKTDLNIHHSITEKEVWEIVNGGKLKATIYVNFYRQISRLVIYPKTSKKHITHILRLAAFYTHIYNTLPGRRHNSWSSPPPITATDNIILANALYFDVISTDFVNLNREELLPLLEKNEVDVVFAAHSNIKNAINAAINQAKVPSLSFEILPVDYSFDHQIGIRFTVHKPHAFAFWKCEWMPSNPNTALNIIPSYHPTMKRWHQQELINGDTDACIGNDLVRYIYAPKASQALQEKNIFGASWSHINHPYRAVGRSLELRLIGPKMLSQDSVDLLTRILRSALNLDDTYIAVSGGFDAPLSYPANKINRLGIRSPYPHADYGAATAPIARGSEAHCVWAYRVLETEGEIHRAFIPFWFIQERWLQIYEGEEIHHGVY